MLVQVCSDLHLERSSLYLRNQVGADVLVLSGDIIGAKFLEDRTRDTQTNSELFNRFCEFFDQVSQDFDSVVYVSGNHEFYGYKWLKTHYIIQEFLQDYSNIFYLEKDYVDIGDVRFVGGVLWTDLNKGDPVTLHCIRDIMNDYKHIVNDKLGFTKLKPATTAQYHAETLKYFAQAIEGHNKVVVCSHHAPSYQSIDKAFESQRITNGAYYSELSDFILDHPQIKLWTHGHIHDPKLYKIGETIVACNPRGYVGYETRANTYHGSECVIEI